jgi:hypothetical protein
MSEAPDTFTVEDLLIAQVKRPVPGFEGWDLMGAERHDAMKAMALAWKPPRKQRVRRPRLESQVRQLLKAGQAVGVPIAVTVEGDKVTAMPTRGAAEPRSDTQDAPPGRSLFKIRAVPKVKVVL